jgi:hypothetical protein
MWPTLREKIFYFSFLNSVKVHICMCVKIYFVQCAIYISVCALIPFFYSVKYLMVFNKKKIGTKFNIKNFFVAYKFKSM